MPKIIVSPLAQADVDEIWDHIARDSIPNADRFVHRMERRFASWPTAPGSGRRGMIFDPVCGASRTRAT